MDVIVVKLIGIVVFSALGVLCGEIAWWLNVWFENRYNQDECLSDKFEEEGDG